MKRLLLASAAFGALIAPALGADLLLKAPAPFPTPWTGWYVGLNAGYADGDAKVDTGSTNTFAFLGSGGPLLAAGITTLSNFNAPANSNGFIGGGQLGWNWQVGKIWLLGFETDIQGTTNSQSSHGVGTSVVLPPVNELSQTAAVSRQLDYLGTLRGRVGVLAWPSLLFYATGGLAYGGVSASTSITQNLFGPNGLLPPTWGSAGSYSGTLVGWTGGVGVEWMFLPGWSTKIEYLHYDLGAANYGLSPIVTNALVAAPFTTNSLESNARFNGDIIRAGLNYHF
jgi:outer membrane immunogenic protein